MGIAFANPGLFDPCVVAETLPPLGREEALAALKLTYSDPEQGSTRLSALIQRYPKCGALLRARASSSHARGLDEAAEDDLRQARALGDIEATRALAVHLHHRSGAGELLVEAVKNHPDDPLLKRMRAAEQPVSERPGLLAEALEAHPDDPETAIALIEALDEAGRPWEAIDRGQAWLSSYQSAELEAVVAVLESPFLDEERFRPTPGEFRLLDDGTEEVVVYSPALAREALMQRLEELGWTDIRPIKGGQRFRSDAPVQPYVDILDNGEVVVQTRGWVKPRALPDPSQKMIPIISARKLRRKRVRMMENIAPEVWHWQNSLARQGFAEKLDATLPDQLTALWDQGVPLYGEQVLDSLASRRDTMVAHWQSRACSPEGDAVRLIVSRFIENVVQDSPAALSEAELRAAEVGSGCAGRFLVEPALAIPRE